MRTDCILDKRQVVCRNSSHIGFSHVTARVGDMVLFREGEHTRTGRMLARIQWAPGICGDKPIKNWLCVAVISDRLDHVCERWVNPVDVLEVYRMEDVNLDVIRWFMGSDIRKQAKRDIDELRRCITDGWSTMKAYRAYMAKR